MGMKKIVTAALFLATSFLINAQDITITPRGEAGLHQVQQSKEINFQAGGLSYFFTTDYAGAGVTNYFMECFDETGQIKGETQLKIPGGEFGNSYDIVNVMPLGDKAYAMVEHVHKDAGKKTLSARLINPIGAVDASETILMDFPFAKLMNGGFHYSAVSPDQKKIAVVGLLPYKKKESATVKVAVYDENLKELSKGEFDLPGEDTKNKRVYLHAANDGTVYITKRTSNKNEGIVLTVYQYSASSNDLEQEYSIKVGEENRIYSYTQAVNDKNELVICGTQYKFTRLVAGDQEMDAVFMFRAKNKNEAVLKSSPLTTKLSGLDARAIRFNRNTVFFGAEQLKEEKITPPASTAGTTINDPTNYNYTHGSECLVGFDMDGNKLFDHVFPQAASRVRNFHKHFQAGYFIVNGEFIMIYNDLAQNHLPQEEWNANRFVPVMVKVAIDGTILSVTPFRGSASITEYYQLFPSYSIQQSANELVILSKSATASRYNLIKFN